jgi:hypothetical protein
LTQCSSSPFRRLEDDDVERINVVGDLIRLFESAKEQRDRLNWTPFFYCLGMAPKRSQPHGPSMDLGNMRQRGAKNVHLI